MPETRFTEHPALHVDPRLGFLGLHRRPMFDYFSYLRLFEKIFIIRHLFHFDILCHKKTFSERHSLFFVVVQSEVTSEI